MRHMFGDNARLVRKDVVPRQYRHVINWGNSAPLAAGNYQLYNNPDKISRATNKLTAFRDMAAQGVSVPECVAELSDDRQGIWLARTVLAGSGGDGIVVIRPGDEVPVAPLYVKYIKKEKEFRLHVVRDEVIFVQQKKRRNGVEQTADEKLIRNHDNGWVFAIEDVVAPDDLQEQAVMAVAALGLDFGAVDCVIGKDDNRPYILEVNTAPGIESPSLTNAYATAFTRMLGV